MASEWGIDLSNCPTLKDFKLDTFKPSTVKCQIYHVFSVISQILRIDFFQVARSTASAPLPGPHRTTRRSGWPPPKWRKPLPVPARACRLVRWFVGSHPNKKHISTSSNLKKKKTNKQKKKKTIRNTSKI